MVEFVLLLMIGFGFMKIGLVYVGGLIFVIMIGKVGIIFVGGGGFKGCCVFFLM